MDRPDPTPACFALLDDRDATRARPTSRLYEDFAHERRCTDPATLDAVWAAVEADQRAGLHAVLLADYEWGAKLLRAGNGALAADDGAALRVLLFRRLTKLGRDEVDAWLAAREGAAEPGPAGVGDIEASVEHAAFVDAIGRVHAAIRAGETYQINYTYRLHGRAYGSPLALYRRLRARQPVAYGALVVHAGGDAVLSCSPELFLRHDGGLLTARPMKGTAPRIPGPEGDSETARLLSLDTKNRAENLMIVDLLRNDLGRLAQIGSVKVPSLFAIEPYTTVFQMTSTVEARPRPEVRFPELLRAVFPCGSITGAPKHHTMELIAGLETTPRGLYCGAIGWVDAPADDGTALGDFCLSVAIRTLTLGAEEADGQRRARLGIGAGIVLDSVPDDEYEECRLKARFLTGLAPGFELFETMRWQPGEGLHHADRHLDRLQASARALGFVLDREAAQAVLARFAAETAPAVVARVRLALAHDGRLALTHAPLPPLAASPVGLLIAPERLADRDPLRAHKTTLRRAYDAGVQAAERAGGFDSLFFTADGRLLEGGRSTVFVQRGGRWFTPPLADGVLPGVARGLVLADPAWSAQERTLRLEDVQQAEALMVCNALRGPLPARLMAVAVGPQPAPLVAA